MENTNGKQDERKWRKRGRRKKTRYEGELEIGCLHR